MSIMPRLKHLPILTATGRTLNPDDREDDKLSKLDDDLNLGDPAAGTSYGKGGKEPDDSHEPATKGKLCEFLSEIREVNALMCAEFDRKLEEKFVDIISIIERNKTSSPTKRLPTSPKPV